MIVDDDDSRRGLRDRGAEHLSGMHQGTVQQTTGDQNLAEHLTLAVEGQQVELLDLEVPQPCFKQAGDILGFPDPDDRRPLFAGEPDTDLEGGEQPGRLGRADAMGPQQLRTGAAGQAAQRPIGHVQEAAGHVQDARALTPRP